MQNSYLHPLTFVDLMGLHLDFHMSSLPYSRIHDPHKVYSMASKDTKTYKGPPDPYLKTDCSIEHQTPSSTSIY